MTKNEIRNFVYRTARCSRKSLDLAREITGRNALYNERQIENIIMDYLEANNFDDDIICRIVAIHPDKVFFDVYYDCMNEKKAEDEELEKAKKNVDSVPHIKSSKGLIKLNADGDERVTDNKKYLYPKIAICLAGASVIGLLVYSAIKNR